MKIVRGDTQSYKFQRLNASGEVITTKADEIYFTVKENYFTEKYIIQKTIDNMTFDFDGTYHFTIEPSDTNDLTYGNYVYDLEVKTDNYVKTIAKGTFEITEEVTFASNEV